MKLIKRQDYLNRLLNLKNTPDIKVLTGIRRSGKSQLLLDYIKCLRKTETNANFIYINFTDLKFDKLKEYHLLNDYVLKKYKAGKQNYLFIDEVQLCPQFELTVNSLYSSGKFDIYITGSNAFLLSSDLATLFTGRTISLEVYPFSFKEFVKYFRCKNLQDGFNEYMQLGGMSGCYALNGLENRRQYLREVFQALVIRDIQDKYAIRNGAALQKVTDFLVDNIGNLVSVGGIATKLTALGTKVTNKTVDSYIKYFCRAFAFYKVKRYDIRGKGYLNTSEKYYLADAGFKYALLGSKDLDYGRICENIVAMELYRRGYEIYVGVLYRKEIDFVAIKADEKIYIQVAANIDNPETMQRELTPLLQIRDAYPKMIIAKTGVPEYQRDGVRVVDIANWLNS